MLLGTSTQEVELVTIEIGDVDRKFAMPVEVTNVDKGELLFLDNPNYKETIAKNPHLSGVVINDQDKKSCLPVHLILGAGEYAKLKTESAPKIGEPGEPVAQLMKFGWIIIAGFVSVFRWFRSSVSVVSAVPVVSFRWFRFGVSGFSTCSCLYFNGVP